MALETDQPKIFVLHEFKPEAIHCFWPPKGITLQPDPSPGAFATQEESLCWVLNQLTPLFQWDRDEEREADGAFTDWRELEPLHILHGLLMLQPAYLQAGWRRIFGKDVRRNERGDFLYSHRELCYIASALWSSHSLRDAYIRDINRAKHAQQVQSQFDDLLKGWGDG